MNSGYSTLNNEVITGKSNRTKALQGLLPPPVVALSSLVGLMLIFLRRVLSQTRRQRTATQK